MIAKGMTQDLPKCCPIERGCHSPRIVIAEDEPELRALVVDRLRFEGYDVFEVGNGMELRELLTRCKAFVAPKHDFDLVVTDVRMPKMTGIEALSSLDGDVMIPPVILITAFGDTDTYLRATKLGAIRVL